MTTFRIFQSYRCARPPSTCPRFRKSASGVSDLAHEAELTAVTNVLKNVAIGTPAGMGMLCAVAGANTLRIESTGGSTFMRRLASFAMLLMLTLVASAASAQEQRGSIEGVVKDTSGAVLPGVTVSLQSTSGAKLEAVTDSEGIFRFPSVAPSTYTLVANLSGFTSRTVANVQVNLGQVRRVEFSLPVAGVAETVEVSAASPTVDLTSAATSTNISRERIELIPRGRDFTDVIGQAAGAVPESQAGGISVNGSSGSENRFIIDGIDTTSPQVGTSAVPMRADFMEEVQVKSAGYAAEFGGSTGGVVNAITRSGSNRFSGSLQSEFQKRSWGGEQRPLLLDSLTQTGQFEYYTPNEDDETRID